MISVVIPSYKNISLCQQAVFSVLKQKACNYEIVITDDSSNNEIEGWVTSLNSDNIRYYHNKPSKGAIDNWNYGLSLAKGDKLILLHHDESFANDDYLGRVDKLLTENDVVIVNKQVLIGDSVKKERFPKWIKRLVIYLKYPLFAQNVIGPCACVAFRKEVMQEFDNRMHWMVDIDWYFRLLKKANRIIYLDTKEIISHHGHVDQITENINISKTSAVDNMIIKAKYNSIIINCCLMLGKILSRLK